MLCHDPKRDAEALRRHYERDGFVLPLPILSRREASDYLHRIEDIERRYGPELSMERYLRFDPHYVLPVIDELVRLPRLLDFVAAILGPDLLVNNTACWCAARTATTISSHRRARAATSTPRR